MLPLPAVAAGNVELDDEPRELADLPERPRPIIELGDLYLAPSALQEGWELPTGAVWTPSILVWGTARSGLQAEWGKARPNDVAQWANRSELWGQLALTATERVVVGFEPLSEDNDFTGYQFGVDGADADFEGGLDGELEALYFEGDVGELFPKWDAESGVPLDLGFVVGRAPFTYQDGFLIDDRMTAVGLVQNSILATSTSNLRASFLAAWNDVHRGGNNRDGDDTLLTGLFFELDRPQTTWALDLAYAEGQDDTNGWYGGISAIRRIQDRWNLTLRVLGSHADHRNDIEVGRGVLGVIGFSFSPRRTHDVAYLNLAASADRYTPAARGPARGGPLGRIGILFEAPGLGTIGAPLNNDGNRALAGALGYQKFLFGGRTQIVLEVAGRLQSNDRRTQAGGGGLRIQQALGRRFILRLDLYGIARTHQRDFMGGRSELVVKF
ncbi:MAG: hypothetical protein AAF430_18850 [Myxococcota bacterium]